MRIALTILAVAALASVPLWLRDPYLLNALITTGIFVIGAMSLNLLLGFTGQLSLGHIAFFGIGAYVSALTSLGFDIGLPGDLRLVHTPWPPIVGFVLAILIAGLCGYFVGLLSFLLLRAWEGQYSPVYWTPVDISGLYWDFVDIIWIFLFPLLYLVDRHLKG